MMEIASNITSLVPLNIETALTSPDFEVIKKLSHLQKVTGLVFIYLATMDKSRADLVHQYEQLEASGVPGIELLRLALGNDDKLKDELPLKLTKQLMEKGDPFEFGQDLTRAVFEMAKNVYLEKGTLAAIEMGTYEANWHPQAAEFLDSVVIGMYEEGMYSDYMSQSKFLASRFYSQIFPPETKRQMEIMRHSHAADGGFII